MTWRSLTVWEWHCDRCGREDSATDDLAPDGWIHTMAGEDLCPACEAAR